MRTCRNNRGDGGGARQRRLGTSRRGMAAGNRAHASLGGGAVFVCAAVDSLTCRRLEEHAISGASRHRRGQRSSREPFSLASFPGPTGGGGGQQSITRPTHPGWRRIWGASGGSSSDSGRSHRRVLSNAFHQSWRSRGRIAWSCPCPGVGGCEVRSRTGLQARLHGSRARRFSARGRRQVAAWRRQGAALLIAAIWAQSARK
jgi:hypothetical protein